MKENRYFRNIALTGVVGLALAACMVTRTFAPMAVLPRLDIPNMVLLSLAALVVEHYRNGVGAKFSFVSCIFAALTFGILPWTAGFVTVEEALNLAILGYVVYGLTVLLFNSIQDRLSTGPAAKAAPILSALGLFLAAQCFAGLI